MKHTRSLKAGTTRRKIQKPLMLASVNMFEQMMFDFWMIMVPLPFTHSAKDRLLTDAGVNNP